MSIIDKALAAITPQPDAERRAEATQAARAAASPGDWLSAVLDHHDEIREAFAAGRQAKTAGERTAAMKALALVLNGHSLAEELVLYPALGQAGEKHDAAHAYLEQTTAKAQMAELENIAPSKSEWLDKWEHIEGAVLTHMFEEESDWFLKLREKAEHPTRITARYLEEYERYTHVAQAAAR
nr:hemerythrin domain-containing protein [uncultured Brevundimonas sp.]